MALLEKFKQYILKENLFQPTDRLLLAVSGGLDSVVLCELCRQAGFDFMIAHCNFQLRGDQSTRDEEFVRNLAAHYGVQFHGKKFDTTYYANTSKKTIEEAARDLRYEWFYSLLVRDIVDDRAEHTVPRYIITAHHSDDNIETVLMNFFRGTGISGLRGILPVQGKVIRPLLFARRGELEAFAAGSSLEFVTDHTNLENLYTRNYFRNTIIPLARKSFPEAENNVLKNIARFRETEVLYQQAIQWHKKNLVERKGDEVHIPVLKLLKTRPLATVMYEIIKDYGFTSHQTDEAINIIELESGKYLQSATHRLIKNRNWIIVSPTQTVVADHILIEAKDDRIHFKKGILSMKKIPRDVFILDAEPMTAQLDHAAIVFPLLLRRWKQGDYFYPLGMQKKKKISRFFTDNKLSLTQKENAWVIEMDKRIIWVVGMRIDDRYKVRPSTREIFSISLSSAHD